MFFSTDAGGIELQKLNFSVAFIFILRSERVGGKSVEYLKRFWLRFFLILMQAIFIIKCLLKGCGFLYFKSQRPLARPHCNSVN